MNLPSHTILMSHEHHHHDLHAAPWSELLALTPLVLLGAVLTLYLAAAYRQRRDRHWSGWRIASFVGGIGLLGIALAPPVMAWGHHDLRGHMLQHLLIGMFAPLGLVLAAPMTLALRSLPLGAARFIVRVLRLSAVHWLAHPWTAFFLNIGGMFVLYVTPLYRATLEHPALHHLVHIHFLAAGCLFTWAIAGPDPAPRRPAFATRLIVLLVSIGTHAYLSKLMYAHLLPRSVPHSAEEIQAAAKLMYYGGDLAELLLAIALFWMWYQDRGRLLRHDVQLDQAGADLGSIRPLPA